MRKHIRTPFGFVVVSRERAAGKYSVEAAPPQSVTIYLLRTTFLEAKVVSLDIQRRGPSNVRDWNGSCSPFCALVLPSHASIQSAHLARFLACHTCVNACRTGGSPSGRSRQVDLPGVCMKPDNEFCSPKGRSGRRIAEVSISNIIFLWEALQSYFLV